MEIGSMPELMAQGACSETALRSAIGGDAVNRVIDGSATVTDVLIAAWVGRAVDPAQTLVDYARFHVGIPVDETGRPNGTWCA
ncbi:hypothetical protein [Nocardia otitidiscaviarum]|uniref:hypothetical protein n=1 Tax=Nocardia otitidiscaviarum TaxID=1823 RepID=UPI0024542971|nr:hypothetical protein [Nocardia otitidiscaviarum]